MLNESYAECLVRRKTPKAALLIKVLLAAVIVLSAASVLVIGPYGFLVFILCCVAAVKVIGNLHVEYEYLFVDRIFSVDRIYNQSRRKKAVEYALEDIQVIAPEGSGRVKEYDQQVRKVQDFTSGQEGKHYALIYQKGGECIKVLFEPDEKMLRCFKMMAPGKILEYL